MPAPFCLPQCCRAQPRSRKRRHLPWLSCLAAGRPHAPPSPGAPPLVGCRRRAALTAGGRCRPCRPACTPATFAWWFGWTAAGGWEWRSSAMVPRCLASVQVGWRRRRQRELFVLLQTLGARVVFGRCNRVILALVATCRSPARALAAAHAQGHSPLSRSRPAGTARPAGGGHLRLAGHAPASGARAASM